MIRYLQNLFARLSFQKKQVLVIVTTSVICIVFANTSFFINDYVFTRKYYKREISVLMELIRINSVAPLYFDDPGAAKEVLASLKASPEVAAAAALYAADGNLFASYQRPPSPGDASQLPAIPETLAQIPANHSAIQVSQIQFKGKILGTLYFSADWTRYKHQILWYALLTLIIAVIALFISVAMAASLRELVLSPLLHLLDTVKRISEEKDFNVRAMTFYDDEIGELIQGFNHMIEQIRRRDLTLAMHRKNLEHRVEERTRELMDANEMLTREKQRAEDANSAKSDFLASMSHELRTPLNGILGYTQLFKKRPGSLGREERERIDVIHECGTHLLEMINDILDLAKVEAGKMEIHSRSFPLWEFIRTTAAIAGSKAREKGLELECRFPDDLRIHVSADDQRIRQVLLNLLSNAVKFTNDGRVTLEVKHLETGLYRFSVEDQGMGIPDDLIKEIFNSFSQLGDIQHKSEGTGLGLAISQQLVRLMGGELQVTSRVGEGSRFWFDLPLGTSRSSAPTAPARFDFNSITGYRRLDGRLDPMKVLIVDDIADNRRLLFDCFQSVGFSIREAENGKEAVKACIDTHFDLILMDIVMPVMGGIQASETIYAMPGKTRPHIIAVSASTTEEMKHQALRAGCSRIVSKPIELARLFEAIESDLPLAWERREDLPQNEHRVESHLTREQEKKLGEMAANGDISAILDWCTAQGKNHEKRAAVAHIETLARQFRINEIIGFLSRDPGENA